MSEDKPRDLVFERSACSLCGAKTTSEAEGLCRPTRGWDDEWECPGGEDVDDEGYFLQPTQASLAEYDAWCLERLKEDV